ncbi:MAG: PAS domain S-box protein [Deltaproteobacteria bacterium]|nr:PAS domain S-box protein [Deltaproteobacteria bacterium]
MVGKSIYEHFGGKDYESRTYRFRSTEELELEHEERKLAIKLLRRRDEILKAVHLFSERFLRMPLTESSIEPILKTLGLATEVSRVYIFENKTRKDGTLITSQRYEWVAPGIKAQIDNVNLQELPLVEAGFKRWVETLGGHKLIYGHVSEFPEPEKNILSTQDIISIMVAPIFIGDSWWGFIGFDDCRTPREWSPVEIEALKTAGNVLGAAIQRKQAEDALLDSEKKYRRVVENANEGIIITQDGQLKFVNNQTSKLSGYSEKELRTRSFLDFVHPDDREMVIEHHLKWLSGKEIPRIYSFRMIDKNGSIKWIQNNGVIIEWEGRPATLNFLLDYTERKEAVNALAESEEKIRALNQQLIKAQESERNRIAGYLHDHVAQDLSSLKIGLETLFDNQREVSAEISAKICDLSKILQDSITAVRDLSYDLHPPGLEQLGLVRTVYQYCEDFSEKNNVSVDFFTAGMKDLKLDFDTKINLYRLIQEGLNNIKKHAEAGHVIIRLVASSPNIILRIEDNGKGFDVERRLASYFKEKRMGLSSMEERVSLLEGTMSIKSQPSKGTRIFIEVPCKERTDD